MKKRNPNRLNAILEEATINPKDVADTLSRSIKRDRPKTFEEKRRHLKMEELVLLLTL